MYDHLMQKERDEITYKIKDSEEPFKVVEGDSIWEKYKGKHIVEVIQELPKEAQEFTDRSKQPGLSEIEQLKRQPKRNDLAKRYRACQAMATQIVQIYKEKNLARLVEVEQLVLSGVDDFGKTAPNRTLIQEISKMKKELTEEDFLRLLWLYLVMYDLPEKDISDFVNNNASSPRGRDILRNLKRLGAVSSRKTGKIERRLPLITGVEFKRYKER